MMKLIPILLFALSINCSIGQTVHQVFLQSKMNGTVDLDNGTTTNFWGYSTYIGDTPHPSVQISLPGPELRFNEGDSVYVTFYNNSPEDHTIHWHGLDVNQENDGVPTTSSVVDQDSNRVYAFKCTHAGTYNYHCHVFTTLHLAMGMYGSFIVDADASRTRIYTGGPTYTKEHNWLASEMNQNWNDNPISPGLLGLYQATYFMINGKSGSQLHDGTFDVVGNPDDTIALRLSNMGYGRVRYLFPAEAFAAAHMSDGRALPAPLVSDTIDVYSGERYTVLLNPESYFTDSIRIEYTDLRTNETLGHNTIAIRIEDDSNVEEIKPQNASIQILGNPVSNILTVKSSMKEKSTCFVYNQAGQLVGTFQINPGINIIPFELNSGSYFLRSSEDYQPTIKFVVYN